MIKQIKITKPNAQMMLKSFNKILQILREELLKYNPYWMNQFQLESINRLKNNLKMNGRLRLRQKLVKQFRREINKRLILIKDRMKMTMQFLLLLQLKEPLKKRDQVSYNLQMQDLFSHKSKITLLMPPTSLVIININFYLEKFKIKKSFTRIFTVMA